MSKDGYLGLDTVPFHWSSILNVMYGLNQKLFEGLFLHDKRFEGWWKRLEEKNKIDQSTHFLTVKRDASKDKSGEEQNKIYKKMLCML